MEPYFKQLQRRKYENCSPEVYIYPGVVKFKIDEKKNRLQSRGKKRGGKRKKVKYHSSKSRNRQFQEFGMLDKKRVPNTLEIGLTFPGCFGKGYQPSPRRIKQYIGKLCGSLRDLFGGYVIWKLEYQKRGAPEYHVLYFYPNDEHGKPCLSKKKIKDYIKKRWIDILFYYREDFTMNDKDFEKEKRKSIKGGIHIEKVDELSAMIRYVCKNVPKSRIPDWHYGTFWGSFNFDKFKAESINFNITIEDLFEIKRIIKEFGIDKDIAEIRKKEFLDEEDYKRIEKLQDYQLKLDSGQIKFALTEEGLHKEILKMCEQK